MAVPIQPLISVLEFPPTLMPLKERIESFGYSFFHQESADSGLSSPLAIVPLSMQTSLDNLTERIQSFRIKDPVTPLVGINLGRMRFKKNEAYAAGIQFLYSLPFEEEILVNKIFELCPPPVADDQLTFQQLMPVRVIEIGSATELPFSLYLYLPYNQKILLYYQKNQKLDEERIQKFKDNAHWTLYIRRTDIRAYKKYCADLFHKNDFVSGEAGQEDLRRKSAERLLGLMGDFFCDEDASTEDAQVALENLKSVVDFIETNGTSPELVKQVSQLAAHRLTQVNHAQNVAAYCCLFGLALNQGDPSTLKLGGLLHDLGLSDMPPELIGQDIEKMSHEDAAVYRLHPGSGKISIEEKKIPVPSGVFDMVLFHHERPDGSGYPYGKKSNEIPILAKICAFADEFDKLTSIRVGYRQLSPVEAVRRIAGLDGEKPLSLYEEAVHRPLVDLLLKPKMEKRAHTSQSKTESSHSVAAPESPIKSNFVTFKKLLENSSISKTHSAGLSSEDVTTAPIWKELADHFDRRASDSQ
jgi:HD-GYP domain-containing protein (c-di-GMP phosphodiesterase class II)